MNLRPPTFRIILALAGATLILWGAKGAILQLPVLDEVSLFDMNRNAAWVLVIGAVAAVGTSRMSPGAIAWVGWLLAVGSLIFLVNDLATKINSLREAGLAPVDQVLNGTVIKPGAVSVLCGLVIQAVGLSLKRKVEV